MDQCNCDAGEGDFDITEHMEDPDQIGASEYRAVYEELESCQPTDFGTAIAILEEIEMWAGTIKRELEKKQDLEEAGN